MSLGEWIARAAERRLSERGIAGILLAASLAVPGLFILFRSTVWVTVAAPFDPFSETFYAVSMTVPLSFTLLVVTGLLQNVVVVPLRLRILAFVAPVGLAIIAGVIFASTNASRFEDVVAATLGLPMIWGLPFSVAAIPFLFPARRLTSIRIALGALLLLCGLVVTTSAVLTMTSPDWDRPAHVLRDSVSLVVAGLAALVGLSGAAWLVDGLVSRSTLGDVVGENVGPLLDDLYVRRLVTPEERIRFKAHAEELVSRQRQSAEAWRKAKVLAKQGIGLVVGGLIVTALGLFMAIWTVTDLATCAACSSAHAATVSSTVGWVDSFVLAVGVASVFIGLVSAVFGRKAIQASEEQARAARTAVLSIREGIIEHARAANTSPVQTA